MIGGTNQYGSSIDIDLTDDLAQEGSGSMGEIKEDARESRLIDIKFKQLIHYPILALLVVSCILYVIMSVDKYFQYIGLETQPTQDQIDYINGFKERQNWVMSNVFGQDIDNTQETLSLDKTKPADSILKQINTYIEDRDVSFIVKKEQLKSVLQGIISDISQNKITIDKLASDKVKYSFVHSDIFKVIKDNEIQRALLSIESIKFYTAMKIFSYMNSFVKEFAMFMGYDVNNISNLMSYYVKRGEQDTERYLNDCYLNPYETDSCNQLGDFANSYRDKNNTFKDFHPEIFVNLIKFIDGKLENDSFPKLSIVLNNLDPKQNQISFSVEINTYKDDEVELSDYARKMGLPIKIPHVYVVTELLNSLRKSHYIIGSNIILDTLKVNKKKVKQGNLEFNVNNSKFTFMVPVQNDVEREIFDNVYNNK